MACQNAKDVRTLDMIFISFLGNMRCQGAVRALDMTSRTTRVSKNKPRNIRGIRVQIIIVQIKS